MSKRLQEVVDEYLIKNGPAGKAELCRAVGRSVPTLDRWLKDGPPTAHDAYTLAKGAGCTDEEALALAGECFPRATDGANKRKAS
jgi:hypothetical protein